MNKSILIAILSALLLPMVPAAAVAQGPATEYEGAAALGLQLRQLGASKRVLMIGAHPDDESTQILAALALGQGAQTAYLSLTRGEGGQNGIGPELQEALGLVRSEELLAARRLDAGRQFFTRAYDYGYSKSADEAFRHWPRDSLLADVVAVVREFRPDVVLSIFSGTPRDGHGQHQAAGILARDAFQAAGDPARFPEQLARGLRPHTPSKLYHASWRPSEQARTELETGELDPLLGRSHYQVAAASRSRHRSQDMGRPLEPGPQTSRLRLLGTDGRLDHAPAERMPLWAGVDTALTARARASAASAPDAALIAALQAYERSAAAARAEWNPLRPQEVVPALRLALQALRDAEAALPASEAGAELRFRIAAEREQAAEALRLAAGVLLDAVADEETVVPGQAVEVELSVWNAGERPLSLRRLEPRLPAGWTAEPLDPLPAGVAPGALATRRWRVRVPADAMVTEPYYLRDPRAGDLYLWPADRRGVGSPFEQPPVVAVAEVELDGLTLPVERAASYRGLDRRSGEFRRPVRVVPAASVALEPELLIVPAAEGSARTLDLAVAVRTEAPRGVAGTLRLDAPAGWTVEPASAPVRLDAAGQSRAVRFTVRPPPGVKPGSYPLSATLQADDGQRYARGYSLVDYEHITPRPLYRPARAAVRVLDVQVPQGLTVGYVPGAGDAVPDAVRQLGLELETLDADALATGDLDRFDVIVTGIRAYEVNPDLVAHNQRLMDYARRGGTLIVQYNKYEFAEPGLAPYPVDISRPHDRVTDETAPVRLLDPAHPLFTTPNRITDADFQGWVQERGLYFLGEWDARYTPLLEMSDPGEDPLRGSLLVAPLGEGTYVYTGLAFFRQLPAGVPGAYRLFANLLAMGNERE